MANSAKKMTFNFTSAMIGAIAGAIGILFLKLFIEHPSTPVPSDWAKKL